MMNASEIIDRLVTTRSWIISLWRRTPFQAESPILALNGDGDCVHLSEVDIVTGTVWKFERSKSQDSCVTAQCVDLYNPSFLGEGLKMTNDENDKISLGVKGYEPFKGIAGSLSLQFVEVETDNVLCSCPTTGEVKFMKEVDADEMITDKGKGGKQVYKYNCAFELHPMEDI